MADSNRFRSAEHAVTGGGLLIGAAAANHRLDAKLAGRGLKGIYASAVKRNIKPYHAAHAAGKLGVRSLQAAGLPLASVGAYGMVKPHETRRMNVKRDVVRPIVRSATFADAADKGREILSKDGGTYSTYGFDGNQLNRKKRARAMNYTAAGLGAAALAARAPAGGKALARRLDLKPTHRLHNWENHVPAATRLSNRLGIASLSTSAANSYNTGQMHHADIKRSRPVVKSDSFVRQYRDRISPEAESGYNYLRQGRNRRIGESALSGAGSGLATGLAVQALRQNARGKAALLAGLAASNAAISYRTGKDAKTWNNKMGKIKAKAYERESKGVYGRPVQSRADVAKAFLRVSAVPTGNPFPKGLLRKPAIRSGGIRRLATGGWSTFRGSVG